ncbi:glycosyltransferase [Colwellia sp. MB02u-14]|uniref:glycosyltransferase n=1 Tax=Colwellia sp. MB02u-14 TaxID=2759815 RepID=UPI0015F59CAA|nr:glycosyltransferase [Colwellia sp. MB02u-14]MBA6303754.1 glycosyltransferase [Colwellia sp. MB02u-14]
MKILHISYSDAEGGAGVACLRLHKLLLKNKIDSTLLVINKHSSVNSVFSVTERNIFLYVYFKIINRISELILKLDSLFVRKRRDIHRSLNVFPNKLVNIINSYEADIIHLHWINGEMLSIYDIKKISGNIIWTLHDSWPFLSTYHHDLGLNLSNLDKCILNIKAKHYPDNLSFISPSHWMKKQFLSSIISSGYNCKVIPNLVTEALKNDFADTRISNSGVVNVLIGSVNFYNNSNKGFNSLIKIIDSVKGNENIIFNIFGESELHESLVKFKNVNILGIINDEQKMLKIMSESDWVFNLSKIESFGLVACESISIGTPVICFNTSGLRDIVKNDITGYIFNEVDEIISFINTNSNFYKSKQLHNKCLAFYQENFSEEIIINSHIQYYEQTL